MTEAEWLASRSPDGMIRHLELARAASVRKLRLLGGACCRRIWPLLADPRGRHSVEVAERYADGLASYAQRIGALRSSSRLLRSLLTPPDGPAAAHAAYNAANAANWV